MFYCSRKDQILSSDLIYHQIIYNKIMTIENKIRDGKLQYDINRGLQKYQLYHQAKLINMNTILVKRYYHLINNK